MRISQLMQGQAELQFYSMPARSQVFFVFHSAKASEFAFGGHTVLLRLIDRIMPST
jgi:hypothetical protein